MVFCQNTKWILSPRWIGQSPLSGRIFLFSEVDISFPDVRDGLKTFWSARKLYDPFLGLLVGFSIEFGLEKTILSAFPTFWQFLIAWGCFYADLGSFFPVPGGEIVSFLEFCTRRVDVAP